MRCSFCESTDKERTYVEGANSSTFICSSCVEAIYDMVIKRGVKTAADIDRICNSEDSSGSLDASPNTNELISNQSGELDGNGMQDVSEEIKEIFFEMEDTLAAKSLLVGIAPSSMVSVTLNPEFYYEDGDQRIKCTIRVECTQEESVDDELLEAIADAVSDFFNDSEYKTAMCELGYQDMPDWWLVEFDSVSD